MGDKDKGQSNKVRGGGRARVEQTNVDFESLCGIWRPCFRTKGKVLVNGNRKADMFQRKVGVAFGDIYAYFLSYFTNQTVWKAF